MVSGWINNTNVDTTKIQNDLKNVTQLRGGKVDQTLVNAAYYGARDYSDSNTNNWMKTIGSAATSFFSAREIRKAAKDAERSRLMKTLEANALAVYTNSGAMGTEFFNIAFEHVEGIKNEFSQAVKDKDTKLQASLKVELNQYANEIKSLKGNINEKEIIKVEKDMNSDDETVDDFFNDVVKIMENKGINIDKTKSSYTLFDDAIEE